MPSQKVLEQKQAIVANLAEELKESTTAVIVDYRGISVADDTVLRREYREAGVTYRVVKNTLLRLAAKEIGHEGWDEILEGTTAIAMSKDDVVAPARIAAQYATKSKGAYVIKGGFIDGKNATVEELNELATIPSREVLLARVLGGFNSPIVGLAMTIKEIANKKEQESA
ncbi:MAG: 50S ribosomal protein L10 [Oscillospiraceae bacterium]|nr:50S ribosomal protein L10 [Oscillospiraceae bacterium]MBQ4101311.1 50S ribosomal protein L10 [Oscillospiraceae bacterium]